MTTDDDTRILLVKALIEQYLTEKGYSTEKLKELPHEEVEKIMEEATRFALLKSDEIEARQYFKDTLAGDSTTNAPPPKK